MRFVLAAVLLALQTAPQAELPPLSPDLLRGYLTYLASDELEGRCAGYPGNDKATEFIAERFRESGVQPAGDAGPDGKATYFQRFELKFTGLTTRNCAGLLKGTDLADEIVVLGAHHDHVGRRGQQRAGQLGEWTKDDEIWNGADDNGSGTTALLGVVRHLAATGARPRRSILFLTFSAEEWGLLGSRHYVEHPLLPLEKTVAMFNMDMVGRTDTEYAANAYGLGTAAGGIFGDIIRRAGEKAGLQLNTDDNFGPGSDHVSFFEKKIPILGLSERGPCPDYHRVTDHADRIDYKTMDRIARAAATALLELANLPERPKLNPDFKLPVPPEPVSPRLGAYLVAVEGDPLKKLDLGPARGALSITGFAAGSIAQLGGVKEGDVILSLAGDTFAFDNPRETLNTTLSKIVRSEPVPLEIVRNGARMQIKLSWPATEADTKVKELIASLSDKGDPAIEKEIADHGEAAHARALRMTGELGKRVRSGVAIRRLADNLPSTWGTRTYRLRDAAGREAGAIQITVTRVKGEKDEPLKIDSDQTYDGHRSRHEVILARDSRLSLIKFKREADGETRSLDFDPKEKGTNRTVHLAMMLMAGAAPEAYRGVVIYADEGRPEEAASLEAAGTGSFEMDGKKYDARKVIKKDVTGGEHAVWIDSTGVVLMIQGSAGRVELIREK